MTDDIQELFENGICICCGGDDVECLAYGEDDCVKHRCLDCGYVPEQDYSTLRHEIEYHGGE